MIGKFMIAPLSRRKSKSSRLLRVRRCAIVEEVISPILVDAEALPNVHENVDQTAVRTATIGALDIATLVRQISIRQLRLLKPERS